ncbi:MAG: hypothetical protein NTZ65_00075 [Candidatus Berkelbacteria bacterium]|nr:hypothetical protein [Candidatus Berkelbacteria bacterium]
MAEENEKIEQPKFTDPKVRPDKIWKAILLIVATVLVFGYIGIWYGRENPKKETETTATVSATAVSSATTSATTAKSATSSTSATPETASWKTYTNDTYGFSFKYPSDWTFQQDGTIINVNSPENQALKNKIDSNTMYGEGYSPTIMFRTFVSASDYVNQGNPSVKSTKTVSEYMSSIATANTFNETTLGGQKAYEDEEGGFAGSYYNITCEHNTTVFTTQIVSEKKSLTDTEQSILSTFQFTPVK